MGLNLIEGWWNGKHASLKPINRALEQETFYVNVFKFGEAFNMVIPSQAYKEEGVET